MRIVPSQMKQQAKRVLSGNRLTAAIMVGVIMAAMLMQSVLCQLLITVLHIEVDTPSVYTFISLHNVRDIDYLLLQAAMAAIDFVIIAPLVLGFTRSMTRLCLGNSMEAIDLFYYFGGDRYVRALGYMFKLALRLLGWSALLLLPALAAQVAAESIDLFARQADLQSLTEQLYGAASLLTLVGLAVLIFILLRYFLSSYCYVLDDGATPRDCFAYSRALTKQYINEIWAICLSFIGWLLLCLLVFPALFVLPYVAATLAFTAVQLIGEDRRLSAELAES